MPEMKQPSREQDALGSAEAERGEGRKARREVLADAATWAAAAPVVAKWAVAAPVMMTLFDPKKARADITVGGLG